MSRILHKIEEKLHLHQKHGDDPAQNKPEESNHENDESNANKKDDINDKKNLVKRVAGKIAKKILHGHHRNPQEEGYEGEEEEEVEVEVEEGGFEFELERNNPLDYFH
ncbi:hypothetical protein RND71_009889 [Anisodus tanguticus]|uniref:Uncharacterized protein n=1 Tax=Anisodus tanguticus TaxID=243964 RepID=A0AAE1SIV6_9SOLA|nr:hypothetical protein RND71_009889 [Anisodus tanguticus]